MKATDLIDYLRDIRANGTADALEELVDLYDNLDVYDWDNTPITDPDEYDWTDACVVYAEAEQMGMGDDVIGIPARFLIEGL
jgi:hypothetical protein